MFFVSFPTHTLLQPIQTIFFGFVISLQGVIPPCELQTITSTNVLAYFERFFFSCCHVMSIPQVIEKMSVIWQVRIRPTLSQTVVGEERPLGVAVEGEAVVDDGGGEPHVVHDEGLLAQVGRLEQLEEAQHAPAALVVLGEQSEWGMITTSKIWVFFFSMENESELGFFFLLEIFGERLSVVVRDLVQYLLGLLRPTLGQQPPGGEKTWTMIFSWTCRLPITLATLAEPSRRKRAGPGGRWTRTPERCRIRTCNLNS